jgi:hypothetical protein
VKCAVKTKYLKIQLNYKKEKSVAENKERAMMGENMRIK